jgi:hypothetical protein
VTVGAVQLQPLEEPESYARVPRRVGGRDGMIRPWSGLTLSLTDGQHAPSVQNLRKRVAPEQSCSASNTGQSEFAAEDPDHQQVQNSYR